jgi:hypothetical protein
MRRVALLFLIVSIYLFSIAFGKVRISKEAKRRQCHGNFLKDCAKKCVKIDKIDNCEIENRVMDCQCKTDEEKI